MQYSDTTQPFSHQVYFRLSETTDPVLDSFIKACRTFYSGHKGQIQFFVGQRALEIRGPKNAVDYDVSLTLLFENYQYFEEFNKPDLHTKFHAAVAGMISRYSVYSSFLETESNSTKTENASTGEASEQ